MEILYIISDFAHFKEPRKNVSLHNQLRALDLIIKLQILTLYANLTFSDTFHQELKKKKELFQNIKYKIIEHKYFFTLMSYMFVH